MELRWRRLSRNLTPKIHFFFDQCIPPIIRDSRWFMYVPFRVFFKNKAQLFLRFKEKALSLSEAELAEVYRAVQTVVPDRQTDLNEGCLNAILENLCERTVLEVGSGRGFLAMKLSATRRVTAVDILVDSQLPMKYSGVRFVIGNIERLPFQDGTFDTVVCTHTLEHVQHIFAAVSELRRVAKRRMIIVVPKQRPYQYTFDLHVHFFPYKTSLLAAVGTRDRTGSCQEIGGDLFYVEDAPPTEKQSRRGKASRARPVRDLNQGEHSELG